MPARRCELWRAGDGSTLWYGLSSSRSGPSSPRCRSDCLLSLTQWKPEVRQFVPRERPSHLNSLPRTSERTQDHVELGLELRDSSELDAQLSFSVAEPLVDRPGRCDGGRTASNCARSGGCTGRRKCQSSHGVLRSRERMP